MFTSIRAYLFSCLHISLFACLPVFLPTSPSFLIVFPKDPGKSIVPHGLLEIRMRALRRLFRRDRDQSITPRFVSEAGQWES